ncbi:MAG TPA: ABC transporter permease [Candidatus Omnitrophota bacterium]|nr:ABC transporter permease [Candidatus Omnitrophota bacterium]HPD84274.1 ABC transporter permease [Candidatus Omnitrophota bacterium]HRZ03130.1 ABC transporter permease [Candidatus Omnitrophota bacterium]
MGSEKVKALEDVSLKILPGEFVAIMGPSGSGKSTLMHILGLLDRPESGDYYLGKIRTNDLSDEELAAVRNRLVGFVFQQFHLLPRINALENAALPLIYAGKQHLKEEAKRRIEEVGLGDRAHHRPNELSGGQQQRVAIARSLVNDPLIIFADEPTGNLDSKSKEEIIGILKGLNQKGKTIVMVTHENEMAVHAKRIIRTFDGKVISDVMQEAPAKLSGSDQADKLIDAVLSKSERKARETKFLEYLRQASQAMLSHKMRSFLSILGILIGVAAVIAMLALGTGAKEAIEKQLASLGSNLIMVMPGSSRIHGVSLGAGAVTRFTFQDVAAIEKLTGLVKKVSPSVTGRGQLVYANKNWNTQVEGVGVNYAEIRAATPAVGRFFTDEEVRVRDKVAVLGTTVAAQLFGDADPIGETIKINLVNFKVIGILPAKGATGFRDQDDTVVIPVTTAMYRVFGKEYLDSISVEADGPDVVEEAQDAISGLIIKQHRLMTEDEQDSFQIRNMADIKNTLTSTTKTMSLLLGAIAAISLLVGGIGIMNIMLVSVTERTREIGLRKAVGANNKDIMVQFMIEAVLMSFIGGIAGILLGGGVSVLITLFVGWAVRVSWFSVILATTFSLVVGVVFGMWPAQKASQLDPIEALRYE